MKCKTLIELYDDQPLNNVLAVETFRPGRVVYLSSNETPVSAEKKLERYFAHRGLKTGVSFRRADTFDSWDLIRVLSEILQEYTDVMIDITGGTDAVLFSVGVVCAYYPVPVVTYSRKKNKFFDIQNSGLAEGLPVNLTYTVEDCFMMAGGSMRQGRVDNAILEQYLPYVDPFFDIFMDHRRNWEKIISYIQQISLADEAGRYSLNVRGDYRVKKLEAPEEALRRMERIGFIEKLKIDPERSVSFRFRDAQIRSWMRDVGSVLELYVYKACLDSKRFDDVRISAVVDWDGASETRNGAVSNELDVMCTKGIFPLFISCKTCMIKTEALNELAILRDRFGGKYSQAVLVSTEPARSVTHNRAAELNIRIIDLNDLKKNSILQLLKSLPL